MEQKTETKTEIKIPNMGFIGLGDWKLGSEMVAKSRTGRSFVVIGRGRQRGITFEYA
jgi:hypothetical protein